MQGTIVAVCTSSVSGIPKYPQVVATVAERGLEGDFHNRLERWSYGRKIFVPNVDRHLLLVSEEVKALIAKRTIVTGGRATLQKQGSLAENILVQGLGSLNQLSAGQMLAIRQGEVLLRVIEPAEPCKHVRAAYGLEVYKALMDRRGIYCAVHRGVGEKIYPNDAIQVIPGGEAATADLPPKDKPTADAAKLEFEST